MYDQGTTCDLTGMPRRCAIQYVCQPDGHGEVYEIKETSTCEYEVIILTSLLCPHPVYGYAFVCIFYYAFLSLSGLVQILIS